MVIDLGVALVLIAIVGSVPQVLGLLLPRRVLVNEVVSHGVAVFVGILPVLYFLIPTAVVGRTVGKEVMGLRVVRWPSGTRLGFPRGVLRFFAYFVALVPLGAGFLWIIVDRDRRGWHDHIAGSAVVHGDSPRA
jgi:uncharacterized RDD family membrane protein YckC